MSPFQVLGLTRRASLPEVKRAYAQLLRKHRPDEDPAGFQRIHEAFEACVARCKARDARERETLALATTACDDDDNHDRHDRHDNDTGDDDGDGDEPDGIAGDAPGHAGRDDGSGPVEDEDGGYLPASGSTAWESTRAAPASDEEVLHRDFLAHLQDDTTQALEAWLAQDERLYALSRKHALARRVLGDAPQLDAIDWRRMDVVFRFFEVDSLADPRLRDDFFAREAWLRVRADERFERTVADLRSRASGKWVDRLALEEMFGPASGSRRWKILLLPSAAKEVRRKYEALEASDPGRAHSSVADSVHGLWLPLTDPRRLDWRRLALVPAKILLFAAPIVTLLVAASGFAWPRYGTMLGWTWAVASAGWLAWALLLWVRARYFRWRVDRWGEVEAPPDASILADTQAVTCGVFTLAAMLVWGIAHWADRPFGGAIVQAFLLLGAGGVLVERKPGTRWDAVAFLVGWSLVIICAPLARVWPDFDGEDRASLALLAPAFAILGLLAVDYLHGRRTLTYRSDIAARRSLPLIVLSVLAAVLLGAWYGLAMA
jgi:hypothetical protein